MLALEALLCAAAFTIALATNVLPRGEYGIQHTQAFEELHNVIVGRSTGNLFIRGAVPLPRIPQSGKRLSERSNGQSSAALQLRDVLLGTRATTCPSGYSLCYTSGRCCPDPTGTGRCCNDGTCTSGSQLCCLSGGACPSNQDCCGSGCMPKGDVCCTGNWHCDPGNKCCGDDNCAPVGGECCLGRTSCDVGLHCVTLNGIQGCCKDLSCSQFDNVGSGSQSAVSVPSPTLSINTAVSSISLQSFTATAGGYVQYQYYTTTLIFYYYSYYITTIQSPIPTSTRLTTSTTFSVYASATADARSQFSSLASLVQTFSAITAPGYAAQTAQPTTSSRSSSTSTTKVAGGAPTQASSGGGSGGGSSGGGSASAATRVIRIDWAWSAWCVITGTIGVALMFL